MDQAGNENRLANGSFLEEIQGHIMENEIIPQPLDTLMTRLGLSNANLVEVSTEQLSFKMVQKGRKGRPLTPNVQDKILNALLKLKPELKVRRRELFHYPMDESTVKKIHEAVGLISTMKIKYPRSRKEQKTQQIQYPMIFPMF